MTKRPRYERGLFVFSNGILCVWRGAPTGAEDVDTVGV
jgi:hypothetical protein